MYNKMCISQISLWSFSSNEVWRLNTRNKKEHSPSEYAHDGVLSEMISWIKICFPTRNVILFVEVPFLICHFVHLQATHFGTFSVNISLLA